MGSIAELETQILVAANLSFIKPSEKEYLEINWMKLVDY